MAAFKAFKELNRKLFLLQNIHHNGLISKTSYWNETNK